MNPPGPDRPPPHSEEAEAAALGCALLDPEAAQTVARLDSGVFYDTRHREIHAAIKALNGRTDLVSLHLALDQAGKLQDAGGDLYLATLADKTPSAANLPAHLEDLHNFAVRRSALRDAAELERIAWDKTQPAHAVASASTRLLKAHAELSGRGLQLTTRTAAGILNLQFPIDDNFLGDRLLARGQPFVIAGAGGIGKSRVLLQLAACCITGRDFCSLETHNSQDSRWLIIQAENSNRRLQHDFQRMRDWLGPEWSLVENNLILHTLETDRDSILSLSFPDTEARLTELVTTLNPDVVVFDPLKDFGFGDLNTDADMIATCHTLSRISKAQNPDRLLGVLHHGITGKAGAAKATGFDRASFARNSKVLHAWTRAQINIAPGSEDYSTLVLSCAKCSNGKEFSPFAISIDPHSLIYSLNDSFDLSSWSNDMSGTKSQSAISDDSVRQLCPSPTSKSDLVKSIQNECFCSKAAAYRHVEMALKHGKISLSKSSKLYCQK